MKKKLFLTLFAILVAFILLPSVYASRSNESNNIANKTAFNYKGKTLYASVEVSFNISSQGFTESAKIVPNASVKYDSSSDTFYVSIKRSDINKVFTEKYDNVYSLLQVNIDYHNATKDGFYLMQLSPVDNGCEYKYTKNTSDYNFRNFGYLELASAGFPLSGTGSGQHSIGGGIAVFDTNVSLDEKSEYCVSDFENKSPAIDLRQTKISVTIVEDEKINLGENNKVISAHSDFGSENKGEDNLVVENIDNFYAEYNEKKELQYSWSLYDENGNPVKIDYDTQINLDESEYEEQIEDLFDYDNEDIKDKLKFISFKHEGKLGGTAKVSIYVGDKFKKGKNLNLFYYNKKKKRLDKMNVTENNEDYYVVVDDDGYATFEIDHCSEYVLADSSLNIKEDTLDNNEASTLKTNNDRNIYIIIGLSILILLSPFYDKYNLFRHFFQQ